MIYVYRTTFTLFAGVNPSSVKLTGFWSGDDTGEALLLNGVVTGNSTPLSAEVPFGAANYVPNPFAITSGFRTGENILDFVITDGGLAVTGFRVFNIQLTEMNEAPPVTYNLIADFSAIQNPNGVWSYGWSESRGSAFHLDSVSGQDTTYGHLGG
jgi:hypothetical protein